MADTTLFRFSPEAEIPVILKVEWEKDSRGERDWTITAERADGKEIWDSLEIIVHSSGIFKGATTLEEKKNCCLESFRKMLQEEGYKNIEVREVEKCRSGA
jgi:hypothetical protein